MKRIISILLSIALILGLGAALGEAPAAEETKTHQIEMRQVPMYMGTLGRLPREIPLYFLDGVKDMPYLNLPDLIDIDAQVSGMAGKNTALNGMWDEEARLYIIINSLSLLIFVDVNYREVFFVSKFRRIKIYRKRCFSLRFDLFAVRIIECDIYRLDDFGIHT